MLVIRFNGSVVTDVMIEGRHLQSLYNWIGLHLVAWVWEHPRHAEFADEAATVINKISFNEIKR